MCLCSAIIPVRKQKKKKKEASSGGVKFQVCVMSEARAWQGVGGEGGGGKWTQNEVGSFKTTVYILIQSCYLLAFPMLCLCFRRPSEDHLSLWFKAWVILTNKTSRQIWQE